MARSLACLSLLTVSSHVFTEALQVPPDAADETPRSLELDYDFTSIGEADRELVGEELPPEALRWFPLKTKRPFVEKSVPRDGRVTTFLWLHPSGDLASRHEALFTDFFDREGMDVNVSVPQAPDTELTVSLQNRSMWFDLTISPPFSVPDPSDRHPKFWSNLVKSAERTLPIVRKAYEEAAQRGGVILGGFSQGAFMALHFLHQLGSEVERDRVPLGLYLVSFDLFHRKEFARSAPEWLKRVPICWWHGAKDQVMLPKLQDVGVQALQEHNFSNVGKIRHKYGHIGDANLFWSIKRFIVQGTCGTAGPLGWDV